MDLPKTMPDEVRRVDRPRPDSELFQHREQAAGYGVNPRDGLAQPVVETSNDQTYVPPLEPATFVCMADRSEFVLRAGTTELARFPAAEVTRIDLAAGPRYVVTQQRAYDRVDESLRHLVHILVGTAFVPVVEARAACQHYKRQMSDMAGNPGRKFVSRFCMAQRDENGEYVSLRDGLMFACDLRDPPDPITARRLDAFDEEKILEGRERRESEQHTFDVDTALSAQGKNLVTGTVGSGIAFDVDTAPSAQGEDVQGEETSSAAGIFDEASVREAEDRDRARKTLAEAAAGPNATAITPKREP